MKMCYNIDRLILVFRRRFHRAIITDNSDLDKTLYAYFVRGVQAILDDIARQDEEKYDQLRLDRERNTR